MKLVAILRVKNAMSVLRECLEKLSLLVDEIIILDNGSIDGTIEACREFNKVVKVILQDDTDNFYDGRDRTILLNAAKARYPDWILCIDPDEVFEKHLTRNILDKYMHSGYDRISFRMCHFWLSRKYCRFDRNWLLSTVRPGRYMWRNLESAYFEDVVIHSYLKGIDSKIYNSPFRIKHYGYINKPDVNRKIAVYRHVDPAHQNKYNTSDLNHKDSQEHILRYPFVELNNRTANYAYVLFYKFLCETLLIALRMKRKYLRKLKIFDTG